MLKKVKPEKPACVHGGIFAFLGGWQALRHCARGRANVANSLTVLLLKLLDKQAELLKHRKS